MKVRFRPQIAEANRGGRSYNGTEQPRLRKDI